MTKAVRAAVEEAIDASRRGAVPPKVLADKIAEAYFRVHPWHAELETLESFSLQYAQEVAEALDMYFSALKRRTAVN